MSEYVYSPHINVRSITFYENLDVDGNGSGTPAARLSLSGGVLTLQTWGDLKIVVQEDAQLQVQGNAQLQVQGDAQLQVQQDASAYIAGDAATTVGGNQTTEVGDYLLHSLGDAATHVDGNQTGTVGGDTQQQTTGLHRTTAAQIERHATEHLKDDAGGVGHTYMPDQVHSWMPWKGAGDCPKPPEHPLTASNGWCWPDGELPPDADPQDAPQEQGATHGS